jgi:AAA+ ATPase superfamily predicted ATPase
MEYLSIEYREYLLGREAEINDLMSVCSANSVVLLLGESGVGKTSMIHAGLIPAAILRKWRVVPTRPFGLPCTDICRTLLATIFEGRPTYTGSLIPLLGEIAGATREQTLLLIVDQFEDILLSRDFREVENLISDLRNIRDLSPPSVRVLLSYRADLEGRIGQYWQRISGSPEGLPRLYLKGVSIDSAWKSVEKAASSLEVRLDLRDEEKERVRRDLLAASNALGFAEIYPPYIQMAVDHFYGASVSRRYSFESYRKAGGMDGIIAGYLGHLLEYAQDTQGNIKAVLVSLVRSYGVKAQKELKEIAVDTGLNETDSEQTLEQLIDLRLVRHIPPYYEISHDFIARRIADELVGIEELEFKRFKELLTSKAAAFRITHSLLSTEEQLMLYKHRQRLIPADEESHLLLSTWVRSGGPALFWLLSVEKEKLIAWVRAEEANKDISAQAKASAVLLRRKLGQMPLSDKDYEAFRGYQLSEELANLIVEAATALPIKRIVFGLRHRRAEVRNACIAGLVERSKQGNWDWVAVLRNSSSVPLQQAYDELVLSPEVPPPTAPADSDRYILEFRLLKQLARSHSRMEGRTLYRQLVALRSKARLTLLAQALLAIKQGRQTSLLRKSMRISRHKAGTLLKAPRCSNSHAVFNELAKTYKKWNASEGGLYDRASINAKARLLALTIHQMTTPRHLRILRACFKRIRLTPSSREIVLALLQVGNQSDLRLVLNRLSRHKGPVDYWNHTELGRAAGQNMQRLAGGMPSFLKDLIRRREFREYILPSDRAAARRGELLPLVSTDNRALYIRIAAHSAIGAASAADLDELVAVSSHQYALVARSAAVKLTRLIGRESLRLLDKNIEKAIQEGHSASCAEALRYAEMALYGVMFAA